MNDLKKGVVVKFLPEYQDGPTEFDYVLIEDPDGGRVRVMPLNTGLEFPPIQVVKVEWLEKAEK